MTYFGAKGGKTKATGNNKQKKKIQMDMIIKDEKI